MIFSILLGKPILIQQTILTNKMKSILGETRREAINRIQERLGPATSRPIAENTFWELAREKKITINEAGEYLIEDEVTDDSMRDTAKKTIANSQKMLRSSRPSMKRGPHTFATKSQLRNHTMNHNSKAAMKSMKSALSPDPLSNLGDDEET